MGLLEDIWAMIRGLVDALIHSIVDPIQKWVQNAISSIWTTISAVQTAWGYFTSKTLPDLWNAIREAGNNFVTYVENIYNNTYTYVTQEITNVTQNIYRTYQTTEQYITQVIGASEEWVQNFVAGLIPADFVKDPLGYMQTAFNGFIEYWIHGAVKSFQEGLEEGLRESEG